MVYATAEVRFTGDQSSRRCQKVLPRCANVDGSENVQFRIEYRRT
jgi:hypothetical protein